MGENTAVKYEEGLEARNLVGEVVSYLEGSRPSGGAHRDRPILLVRVGLQSVQARQAASCLLEPQPGDRVLVAVTDGVEAWVLSVLQSGGTASRLTVDGDIILEAEGELRLQGRRAVSVIAPELFRVEAHKAAWRLDELSILASKLVGSVLETRWAANMATTVISRLSQRLGYSNRIVENLDQLRAKQVDYAAEGALSLRGDTAAMTAEKAVKIDAGQVIIG